jgi:hypothetical protein
MSKIILHTRSFHPDSNFGFGGLFFRGDSRGFSDSVGATSRIKHFFTIDLTAGSIGEVTCRSDPSENAVISAMSNDYSQKRKQPRVTMPVKSITPYRKDGDQIIRLTFTYAGQNFAFPLANRDWGHSFWSTVVPDLDVTHEFSLRINRTEKKAYLTSSIGGDGFPNCESFMIDDAQAVCFIGTHVRMGTAMTQLPGGRVLPMIRSAYQVDWTDADQFGSPMQIYVANDYTGDGSPHEVAPSGGSSRSAWNAIHNGRDASGDWLRQIEDHTPTGRQTWYEIEKKYNEIVREIAQRITPHY